MSTTLHQNLTQLAVNGLAFGLCYSWTNWLAERAAAPPLPPGLSDQSVPFLPWMVIPYFSSGLAFMLTFLVTSGRGHLRLLSQRTLLVTAIATVCFTLVPLRMALSRPAADFAIPAALFALLEWGDRPFNQLPSLHVAYAVVFWPNLTAACRGIALRLVASAWLVLVIASAAFTWQHNLIDIVAGAALGGAVLRIMRRPLTGAAAVCFYYGVAGVLITILLGYALGSWVAAYLGASLLLVSWAYARRNPAFLGKRHGRHPAWAWSCFAPYLAGYWLTWQLVRLKERGGKPLVQCAPSLWAGRRLSPSEARALPDNCYVIDLAGELSEVPSLRRSRYLHIPLLDLHAPALSVLRQLRYTIYALHRRGHPVYVHCAMGYSRSRLVARIITKGARHDHLIV